MRGASCFITRFAAPTTPRKSPRAAGSSKRRSAMIRTMMSPGEGIPQDEPILRRAGGIGGRVDDRGVLAAQDRRARFRGRGRGGRGAPAAAAGPPPAVVDDGFRGYTLGSSDARVEITEYSDFECPFCANFATGQMPTIREQLIQTGKVQWRYRDDPLPVHKYSRFAAHAAQCRSEERRVGKECR